MTVTTGSAARREPLLDVRDLSVAFHDGDDWHEVLKDVSFAVEPGEVVGIVGESGCGKSLTALSILGLLPRHGARLTGQILFEGRDLTKLSERELRDVRGRRISMVFQEPMSALDPVFPVGTQIVETVRRHFKTGKREAEERAVEALAVVGIASPRQAVKMYPSSLSGGMRQRVLIAMALVCEPRLLIADEPTTALDVTIQAQIMDLLLELGQRTGTAILFITHNLGLVAESCRRMLTMYAGQVVEDGRVRDILARPFHPYTAGLLGSIPQAGATQDSAHVDPRPRPLAGRDAGRLPLRAALHLCRAALSRAAGSRRKPRRPPRALPQIPRVVAGRSRLVTDPADPILTVDHLDVTFTGRRRHLKVKAVVDVSFKVSPGETFGVIGESGSGKSTLGRAVVCLLRPSAGKILHSGVDPFQLSSSELRQHRRSFQIVFQDPNAALDPRMTILESVCEPLDVAGLGTPAERRRKALAILDRVALSEELTDRYPHEISGGQKQRANIARALVLEPRLIVCDEVVAALDVSIQADMLNLFADLQREFGLTYLFISHDLRVVAHISDRVAVMYAGKLAELAPADQLMDAPLHPYTQALLSAEPEPKVPEAGASKRIILKGEIPSPLAPPPGCRFHTRCPIAALECATREPEWREFSPGRFVACHFAGQSLPTRGSAGPLRNSSAI